MSGIGLLAAARAQLDQFRRYAEECVRMAQETHVPEHRALLIDMAQRWIELAEQADRIQGLLDRDKHGTPPRDK